MKEPLYRGTLCLVFVAVLLLLYSIMVDGADSTDATVVIYKLILPCERVVTLVQVSRVGVRGEGRGTRVIVKSFQYCSGAPFIGVIAFRRWLDQGPWPPLQCRCRGLVDPSRLQTRTDKEIDGWVAKRTVTPLPPRLQVTANVNQYVVLVGEEDENSVEFK